MSAASDRTDSEAREVTGPRRWAADLALGMRLAGTGGRQGWVRALLTALGVGLGVALLMVGASVPGMLDAREQRGYARDDLYFGKPIAPAAGTMVVAQADTEFHNADIRGRLLNPDGPKAPVPPGLSAIPAPGEMVVSPALKRLLDAPEGRLLQERLNARVVGTIGDEGLLGPSELAYYAGDDSIAPGQGQSVRIDRIGSENRGSEGLGATLLLLVVIVFVVLLMPVAVFIATAVRFGGERRDRRLAALRLVGADSGMTRRIAAGEALFGSLIGLVVGLGVFLAGRRLIGSVTLWDISVFPSDVTPDPLLSALIALAVPAAAVGVTLLTMRGVAVEPLGVVRHSPTRRRRLWWRLLLPAAGLAALAPLIGRIRMVGSDINEYQVALGAVLLLVGVTAVLPWLVEAVVGRFGGGPVHWQLATRRLQLSSAASARMVGGVTVAVAGAIAVQMLFSGLQNDFTQATGQDATRAQLGTSMNVRSYAEARTAVLALRTTKGVRHATGVTESYVAKPGAHPDGQTVEITVGDCSSLRDVAVIGRCEDGGRGSVYLVQDSDGYTDVAAIARPGRRVDLNVPEGEKTEVRPRLWTIPATARTAQPREDAMGRARAGIFATPSAIDVSALKHPRVYVQLRTDPRQPDAVEYVRNTAARLSPAMDVMTLRSTQESRKFTNIRRGLFIGATATLLLIGAGLLVTTLEQLRERKRLLAVLVAFGTRRSTLGLSVLWQTAVPVVLGLALSVAGGLGLGAMLLKMVERPVTVDWGSLAAMTGVGAGVVLLVTALSLPPLWRMMRPDGLRTE